MADKYHLFKRTSTYKGKRVVKWYYWYKDRHGKQVRKATKASNRKEAERIVRELNEGGRFAGGDESQTLAEFSRGFFVDGRCPYLRRRKEKDGVTLKAHTIAIHRRNLKALLEEFGDVEVRRLDPVDVEDWLISLDRSNSVRNAYIETLRIVLGEAQRRRIVQHVPVFEPFRRQSKRYDTLTDAELVKLFPTDPEKLAEIWGPRPADTMPEQFRKYWLKNRQLEGIMFGAMYCVMVSAGLRSGEARALQREQLYLDRGGIIIDRAYGSDGTIGKPKTGTAADPRFRAVPIPSHDRKYRLSVRKMQIFHVFYRFSVDYSDNGYIMKHIRYEKTGYDTLNQKPITDKQKLIELFEALDIPYQLNGDGLVAASRLYWFNAAGEVERVTDLLTGESWEGEE